MERILPKALPFDPGGKGNTARILETRAGKEPEQYYLQPYRGVIHNQSHYYKALDGNFYLVGAGSCVADAFTAIVEKIEHYKGGEIYPSVSMLYGQTTVDSGMYTDDAGYYLKNKGVMPFQYLKNVAPHMDVYTDALEVTDTVINGVTYKGAKSVFNELYPSKKEIMLKTRISDYSESLGIPSSDASIGTLQRAIKSKSQGVVFSIKIDDAFDNIDDTGVLKLADYKDNNRGYHLINIVGWIHFNGVLHWIIQNSWAQNWGDRGYCYMPYNWTGIKHYGILTGTNDPPAKFADIPKKARFTDVDEGILFEWDAIPDAVSYECKYKGNFVSYDYNTTSTSVRFSTGYSMQFYYRAVYANGTKSLWSNVTRALKSKTYKGIESLYDAASEYLVYLDSDVYCKHELNIDIRDKNGKQIGYTGISPIHINKPSVNNYHDINVKLDYLLEAKFDSVSATRRFYGDLGWQYMKDDTNKEVKITAQEWNDICDRVEILARITVNIPRVKSGDYISADVFNKMVDALTDGFIILWLKYIDKTLIPSKVTSDTPITKQHFIQLKNAINSIKQ